MLFVRRWRPHRAAGTRGCMAKRQTMRTIFFTLMIAFAASAAQATLDRPPELLDAEQIPATNKVRLLWAPGGNADGSLNPNVVSYTVQRGSVFLTPYSQYVMTHEESLTAAGTYNYRVRAITTDGLPSDSNPK